MLKMTFAWTMTALAAVTLTSAKEFPFKAKTLKAEQAMAFPGGYGSYGRLTTTKPAILKQAPKAVSENPLYGEIKNGKELMMRGSNDVNSQNSGIVILEKTDDPDGILLEWDEFEKVTFKQ